MEWGAGGQARGGRSCRAGTGLGHCQSQSDRHWVSMPVTDQGTKMAVWSKARQTTTIRNKNHDVNQYAQVDETHQETGQYHGTCQCATRLIESSSKSYQTRNP